MPTYTSSGRSIASKSCEVYVSPNCAADMVNFLPDRSSCRTSGPVILNRISSVIAPSALRYCIDVSPLPCLHAFTWGERGSRLARTMSPILRCGSMPLPRNSVKACRMKSPFTCFHANWHSSWSPHMLVTDAARRYSRVVESTPAFRSEEFREGLQDEISLHLLPRKLALVVVAPHVGARRRQEILPGVGVERGASGDAHASDVGVVIEDPDPCGLGSAEGRRAHSSRLLAADS